MKWIFFSLLLANLAYLGLNLMSNEEHTPHVGSQTSTIDDGIRRIQLLSERPGLSARESEQQAVLENPVVLDDQQSQREGQRETEIEELPLDESAGDVTAETIEQSEPIAAAESDAVDDAPAAGDETVATVEIFSGCQSVGPFSDLLSATDVSERLNGLDLPFSVTAIDRPSGDSDYRVVLPAFPSLQEAFRRLRELKSRDIDSYVITEGPDAQGISLGVFSTQTAALNQQVNLVSEGYETEIREIPRVTREYWIQGEAGAQLPGYQQTALMVEFPRLKVEESDCLN